MAPIFIISQSDLGFIIYIYIYAFSDLNCNIIIKNYPQ